MIGNGFMSWVLRSPFHAILSDGMMLITVTGRNTRKKYTTPVSYYRENRYLWVMTSRDRTWWKNLQGGAQVSLLLKRKPVTAFAQLELEPRLIEARMHQYLRLFPQAAKSMGVRVENGNMNPEDLIRISKDRLFVNLELLPE